MDMQPEDFKALVELVNADSKYRDSITISTPSKGGEIKVYFNSADPKEAEIRILNAVLARKIAQDAIAAQEAKP